LDLFSNWPLRNGQKPIYRPTTVRFFFDFLPSLGRQQRPLNMPDKPDTWAIAFMWLSQHSQTIWAAFLSLCMTVLRVFYTGGTWKDALIEGPMCVLLSLSIIWGFELMGLSPSLAQPVGIWVGFLGVKKVALWADRIAESRFPKSDC
jgi:lambda family phage holin